MWQIYKINDEPVGTIITKEDVLNYARKMGYQSFNVMCENDGRYLTESDFPFTGDIRIIPVGKLG